MTRAMTRSEAGKRLNSILETVDDMQEALPIALPGRHRERLNAIRDQVMLLALDLKLPIQPVKENGNAESERQPGEAG